MLLLWVLLGKKGHLFIDACERVEVSLPFGNRKCTKLYFAGRISVDALILSQSSLMTHRPVGAGGMRFDMWDFTTEH